MIIGSGLLANAFTSYLTCQNFIIYASGVSNSKETDINQFTREKEMIINTLINNPYKHFIYFSTCSIDDKSLKNSTYVIHKQKMENIIRKSAKTYNIFRLPQVVGKSKAPTLVNYLFRSILNEKKMNILKSATRNLIYIDDVFMLSHEILQRSLYINTTINLATPFNIQVTDIIKLIETIVEKKAYYSITNGGSVMNINISEIKNLECYDKIFHHSYINNILLKYYNKDYQK